MKTRTIIGFSVLAIGTFLTISLGMSPQKERGSQLSLLTDTTSRVVYQIDAVHSSVVFKIGHLGVANFYGRFNDISGSFALDSENPETSSFNIQVKTDSVDSNNERRDGHLKSPDFFNAPEFPVISFKSTKVAKSGDNTYRVTGDLSLHGVTKSITVDILQYAAKETMQGFKTGVETTFAIKRTDFGMDTYVAEGALGDEVELIVSLEGKRQ